MSTPLPAHVAYYSDSTGRQGQSGLGLDAQRSAVAAYVAGPPVLGESVRMESGRRMTGFSTVPRLLPAGSAALCW